MIKLLIGGSPCTYWSIAQKNGRETEANGMGWELFKNYLIAKEKFKPDFFLYENNKSAAQAIKDQIKHELDVWNGTLYTEDSGARYIEINSALVSAQNRQRFYVHNCGEVGQPEDRGILLRDILETGTDLSQNEKSYCLTASYDGAVAWNTLERSQRTMVAEPVGIGYRGRMEDGKWVKRYESNGEPKANALTTATTDSMCADPIRIGTIENEAQNKAHDSKQYRVYSPDGKSTTLCGQGGGVGAKTGLYAVPCDGGKAKPIYEVKDGLITIKDKQYPIKLADGFYIIRKLTVTECCRLQTLPDDVRWHRHRAVLLG